jgi:hypothetical protein
MRADSIEGTGAKPGDKVKCVKDRDDVPRFHVGEVYNVVSFCGKPAVFSRFGDKKESRYMPPFRGYGYEWELVS